MEQSEQKKANDILKKELANVNFTSHELVISKTHPKTAKEKWMFIWNREITIPLVPLGAALFLFFSIGGAYLISDLQSEEQRYIVQKGGSYYWSDMIDNEGNSR
ncbi:hypothetical protein KS419_18120 [Bacillus tamaricis]|uniref:ABC transporter permease n=2 Tax=Evansella tamaricis TaxID=2069301 RepID=A0ABS6JKB9_9BACI|nr:hypothetical protein [Evansella tamaricis]MBU9713649.1 hypothetical protein [Evansella tamaricis]